MRVCDSENNVAVCQWAGYGPSTTPEAGDEAIAMLQESGARKACAMAFVNLGKISELASQLDTALRFYERAAKGIELSASAAWNFYGIGRAHQEIGCFHASTSTHTTLTRTPHTHTAHAHRTRTPHTARALRGADRRRQPFVVV